jgi:hypothetical protein
METFSHSTTTFFDGMTGPADLKVRKVVISSEDFITMWMYLWNFKLNVNIVNLMRRR